MKFYMFSAGWCKPCLAMKPFIAKEFPQIEIIDTDDNAGAKLAADFGVRGLPTIIAADEHGAVDGLVGAHTSREVAQFVGQYNG